MPTRVLLYLFEGLRACTVVLSFFSRTLHIRSGLPVITAGYGGLKKDINTRDTFQSPTSAYLRFLALTGPLIGHVTRQQCGGEVKMELSAIVTILGFLDRGKSAGYSFAHS